MVAGAASNFLILGIVIFSFSPFIKPMHDELGWSVAAISWGVSIRSFQSGALSPFTGYFVDRLGPRNMGIVGAIISAAGMGMFAASYDLWFYYLSSVVIALGQSLGAFTAFSVAIVNWFNKKRGIAFGIFNSGNALGYLAVGIVATLITVLDWRQALLVLAGVVGVFGVLLALVIRSDPERYGYGPDGVKLDEALGGVSSTGRKNAPRVVSGMEVADAVKTPALYLMAISTGIGGAAFTTYIVHLVPHMDSAGFSNAQIAWISGIYGVLQAASRIGSGWIGDIVGRKRHFTVGCLIWAIGLICFGYLTPHRMWLLAPFYLLASLGHAAWSIQSTTIFADYYGTKRYATIRGIGGVVQVPMGVLMPAMAGYLFDRNGNYIVAYHLIAAICASGAVWLFLIRRPTWDKLKAP